LKDIVTIAAIFQ